MKKFILILSGWLLSAAFVNAQKWDSVGAGIHCGNWQDGVFALAVYNGELYVGGTFESAGGVQTNGIARWNGTSWSSLGTGLNSGGHVSALEVYKGELYVGGSFTSAGGIPVDNIAKWNDTSWYSVPGSNGFIGALAVYNGNLIAAGNFTSPGSSIASWNGSTWSTLGLGITGSFYNRIYSLVVYDSILYVGGLFDSTGNIAAANIAEWNGISWSALGSGFAGSFPECISLAIFNHTLYTTGYFDTAGGMPINNYVAQWNGVKWDSLSSGFRFYGDFPREMMAAGNILYFGCNIAIHGYGHLISWDGNNWDSVGYGFQDTGVFAMTMYNNQLYAGGSFHAAGVTPLNNIARFDSAIVSGVSNLQSKKDISIYPNPSNGEFTIQVKNGVTQANKNIEIYNVMGQEVFSQYNIQNSTFNLNLTNQPNGVYLYRVLDETGNLVGEGKIVLDK